MMKLLSLVLATVLFAPLAMTVLNQAAMMVA